jgi:hypothetical protein
MSDGSEWSWVWAAYGLTWTTLTVYAVRLFRARAAAGTAWTRSGAPPRPGGAE